MNGYQALSAVDSILNYKPIALSAYDYYPFGQYMPGRYTEDTNSYCFTTTLTEMVTVVTQVPLELHEAHRMAGSGGSTDAGIDIKPNDDGSTVIYMHRTNAGTGAGVGVPIGGLGNGGSPSDPGDPVHPGGGTSPIEGDVQITATVSGTGVFNVSVTDDSTGKNLGNVLISSSNNIGTIKLHYSGENGHTTSLHVTLDHAMDDNNTITFSVVTVPHYTSVPVSVVSRVCNGESYRYGYNGKYKDNEWAGLGNSYDYGMRRNDPRIGRFISVDPLTKKFPWYSSYQYAGNTPIQAIDLDGAEPLMLGGPSITMPILIQTQEEIQKRLDKGVSPTTANIQGTLIADGKWCFKTFSPFLPMGAAGNGVRAVIALGCIGAAVNVSWTALNNGDAKSMIRSAVSGFAGGATLATPGNVLVTGFISGVVEETTDQCLQIMSGDMGEINYGYLLSSGVISATSNGLSSIIAPKMLGSISKVLGQQIANAESKANKELIKKTLKANGFRGGDRALNIQANIVIKQQVRELTRTANELRAALQQGMDRAMDGFSNKSKDEAKQ